MCCKHPCIFAKCHLISHATRLFLGSGVLALTAAFLSRPVSTSLPCRWDRKYWATYKVLDILQKVFYRSNPAREAFVEMCEDSYVQKMTFDSYLYKTVVPGGYC